LLKQHQSRLVRKRNQIVYWWNKGDLSIFGYFRNISRSRSDGIPSEGKTKKHILIISILRLVWSWFCSSRTWLWYLLGWGIFVFECCCVWGKRENKSGCLDTNNELLFFFRVIELIKICLME
jgi:hypothetical protein